MCRCLNHANLMSGVTHWNVISHGDRNSDVCIFTFRFKGTELWVFLKTKNILKWNICKLTFCGNSKEKNPEGGHGGIE